MTKKKPICQAIKTKSDVRESNVGCKERILAYLNSFESSYVATGFFVDVMTGKHLYPDRLEAYTDGLWYWDTVDIYYFEMYDNELDPEFVSQFV